jgi:hypothetical protein
MLDKYIEPSPGKWLYFYTAFLTDYRQLRQSNFNEKLIYNV